MDSRLDSLLLHWVSQDEVYGTVQFLLWMQLYKSYTSFKFIELGGGSMIVLRSNSRRIFVIID